MTRVERICRLFGEKPPNMDMETGIHYGVINQNNLGDFAAETIIDDGTDLGYEAAVEEMKATIRGVVESIITSCKAEPKEFTDIEELLNQHLKEYVHGYDFESDSDAIANALSKGDPDVDKLAEDIWNGISDEWNQGFESDGTTYRFEDSDVTLEFCTSDGDIFVIKSKFYTHCGECSPCAPNAGYLTDRRDCLKAYALPPDWFDDNKLPYPLWTVEGDKPVIPFQHWRVYSTGAYQNAGLWPKDLSPYFPTEVEAQAAAEKYQLARYDVGPEWTYGEVTEDQAAEYWKERGKDEE